MADKEYVLGNKARELLTYTNQATKIVTDDVSQRDVRKILQKIAALGDIRDVKQVCGQMIGYLDKKDKQGFTKAAYRCYGEDMRKTAKGIVRDIHAAHGDTHALRQKYAEQVGEIIGEVPKIHRKINSTREARIRRRVKQQRCIQKKKGAPISFARPAMEGPCPDDIPPWM